MSQKRKQYSAGFKGKRVMQALHEEMTVAQFAQKHGIHPTTINYWKKRPAEHAAEVFSHGTTHDDTARTIAELYRQIGRLKVSGKPAALYPTKVCMGTISFKFNTMEMSHGRNGRKTIASGSGVAPATGKVCRERSADQVVLSCGVGFAGDILPLVQTVDRNRRSDAGRWLRRRRRDAIGAYGPSDSRERDWTSLKLLLERIEPKRVRRRYQKTAHMAQNMSANAGK